MVAQVYGPKLVPVVGPPGPPGTSGADGLDGATILSGVGPPDDSIGDDGDFYVDEGFAPDAFDWYGPKSGGTWPTPPITIATGGVGAVPTPLATENVFGKSRLSLPAADNLDPVVTGTNDPRLSDSRPPNGAAGGVLSGTYPSPGFAQDMATQAELDAISSGTQGDLDDLTAALAAEVANRITDVNTEETDRIAAVGVEAAARSAADTAEALARTAADSAEASARAAADTAETSARTAAVAAEASARIAADNLLIPLSQKGAANGVATLGNDSKIPSSQLPNLSFSLWLGDSANEAAMLALSPTLAGDWTTRTDSDPNQIWMYVGGDPTLIGSWRHLGSTSGITSVNGDAGPAVVIPIDPAAGTAGLRTLGTGAQQAASGADSRFTDGRAPTGTAGGVLSGTYPNPGYAAGSITNAAVNAVAAIARSKLDFGSGLVNADIAAGAAIAKTKLANLDVVNADVNASAAIARSKLDFGSGLVNADIAAAAAIARSKLNFGSGLVDADIAAAAAIARSKLNFGSGLVDADIASGAAIAQSKIANLVSDLAAKATDSLVVHKAGTETITGAKNFTGGITKNGINVATVDDITATGLALDGNNNLTLPGAVEGTLGANEASLGGYVRQAGGVYANVTQTVTSTNTTLRDWSIGSTFWSKLNQVLDHTVTGSPYNYGSMPSGNSEPYGSVDGGVTAWTGRKIAGGIGGFPAARIQIEGTTQVKANANGGMLIGSSQVFIQEQQVVKNFPGHDANISGTQALLAVPVYLADGADIEFSLQKTGAVGVGGATDPLNSEVGWNPGHYALQDWPVLGTMNDGTLSRANIAGSSSRATYGAGASGDVRMGWQFFDADTTLSRPDGTDRHDIFTMGIYKGVVANPGAMTGVSTAVVGDYVFRTDTNTYWQLTTGTYGTAGNWTNQGTDDPVYGSLTAQIGFDIKYLQGATHNVGLRNASNTVEVPNSQDVAAATTIQPNAARINLFPQGGHIVLTSNPHIAPGLFAGHRIRILNIGGTFGLGVSHIDFVHGNGVFFASAQSYRLQPGRSVDMEWLPGLGWVQTGTGNTAQWLGTGNMIAGGAIDLKDGGAGRPLADTTTDAGMQALTAAQVGDFTRRTDFTPDHYYQLTTADPTVLGHWTDVGTFRPITDSPSMRVLGAEGDANAKLGLGLISTTPAITMGSGGATAPDIVISRNTAAGALQIASSRIIDGNGSIIWRPQITGTTINATLDDNDRWVQANATSGNITLMLPSAATCQGRQYTIWKTDATANTVTIDAPGAELVGGAATRVLAARYDAVTVVSDNTNWMVINGIGAISAGTANWLDTGAIAGGGQMKLVDGGSTSPAFNIYAANGDAQGRVGLGMYLGAPFFYLGAGGSTAADITIARPATGEMRLTATKITDSLGHTIWPPQSIVKTAAYTATAVDDTILADATSAAFTVTLPTAVGRPGRRYTVKKTDSSTNAITIATVAPGTQTIDGVTTYSLPLRYQTVTVQSDGTNWFVVNKPTAAWLSTGTLAGGGAIATVDGGSTSPGLNFYGTLGDANAKVAVGLVSGAPFIAFGAGGGTAPDITITRPTAGQMRLTATTITDSTGAQIWPMDADLTALAALTSAADKIPYATGAGTWAMADFTSTARTLLDDTSVGAMRTTLGAAPTASPTFTGTVTVPTPSGGTDATTKTYVDNADALKAPLASPTFTGTVTLPATGAGASEAATKSYVDTADALKAPLASPTFTGTVIVPTPSGGTSAATKAYVDGILTAPTMLGPATIDAANQTFTATQAARLAVLGGTTTLNFVDSSMPNAIEVAGTASLAQSGNAYGLAQVFRHAVTYKNANGVSANLGPVSAIYSAPTFTADNATINGGTHNDFTSVPSTSIIGTGVLSGVNLYGFRSDANVGTGTTVTTRTGLNVVNATVTGTLTTQVGVDIASLTTGGTNIGIRNKSQTQLGSSAQTVIGTAGTFTTFAGFADAVNIAVGTTTGTKIGTATTQKLGFFNATPVVQGTAFTQTYSTATHTHSNITASAPPAGGTGATAGAYDTAANRNAMITSLTNVITDVANVKQVVNGLIDDLQALGLIA